MSFSSAAKDEIVSLRVRAEAQRRAMLCALTLTTASVTIRSGTLGIEYVTESHSVGKLIASLATGLYAVDAALMVREHERLRARNTVVLLSGKDCRVLLADMGFLEEQSEPIPGNLVEGEALSGAFVRGLFLGAGSVSDPKKGYHLELVLRHEQMANAVLLLLNERFFNAKLAERRNSYVVYIKEAERICEFLAFVGAMGSVLAFENIRVEREIKNNLNRQSNFEEANMQKTAESAAQQLLDIRLIMERIGLSMLPQKLRETAELRLNDPEATLSELALELGVGKSGVNHRLKKLSAIAEELRLKG